MSEVPLGRELEIERRGRLRLMLRMGMRYGGNGNGKREWDRNGKEVHEEGKRDGGWIGGCVGGGSMEVVGSRKDVWKMKMMMRRR
jgi:hypothetical protein